MTTINDLRGFCYPLTPGGVSSLVGDLPWHYATEYVTIAYRTDPAAIAAYLPEPLAPAPEPDLAYVAFSRWWSLWDNQPEMAFTNPERTQYRECAIWVGCSRSTRPPAFGVHAMWLPRSEYRLQNRPRLSTTSLLLNHDFTNEMNDIPEGAGQL